MIHLQQTSELHFKVYLTISFLLSSKQSILLNYLIRVPFVIRGPGIAAGTNITRAFAGNVDLMPTMLDFLDYQSMVNIVWMENR